MITVLITTYNCSEFIPYAIRSVLLQDFKQYEILVIDDGSEDNTEEIVKSFKNDSLNYIKIQHRGRSEALNYGLKAAKYDWVTLLDADDLMSSEKLSRLSVFISDRNNLVITTWMGVYTENHLLCSIKYPSDHLSLQKFLLVHSFNNSVMYNKQFIMDCGSYSECNLAEDYDLWLRIFNKAEFICIPEFLCFHRYRSDSFSNKNFYKTKEQIRSIHKQNSELLDKIETEASERDDILLRREYFFGESILSVKPEEITLKYVLLFLLSLLPGSAGDYIRILNLKARINYYCRYFSEENIYLRNKFKIFSGDGNKIKLSQSRGLIK